MPTEKKVQTVKTLTEVLSRSSIVIGTEYRGMRVADITALRRQLRDTGVEMHVVKNTLFRRAAEAAGRPEMSPVAEGPTALVIGFDDPIAPVKALVEYQRTARNTFVARSAYMDGVVYAGARLTELATLPSKDALLAQLAGALQSPIAEFVGLIGAAIQEFSGLLSARAEQMEGAA